LRIGLIDVDGHNFPNLALMKISAYHKARGDSVEWWNGFKHYDRVYQSKVFDSTYTPDNEFCIQADEVIKGGTGYGLDNKLPDEIEHTTPDYSLYGITNTAYGFLSRGCPRACPFCIVAEKEGRKSIVVADLTEWWSGQKNIVLLDPNLLACKEHIGLLEQLETSKAWVDFTQGLDARLLTEDNINALNKVKTKMLHFAWDLMNESEKVIRGLGLYAKHGAIQDVRKRRVYVLCNYNTTMEENLYRVYKLKELQYDPYVMIYDKPHAPKEIKRLQRWVNNKYIFRSCERFEDYQAEMRT
jgi:organic radical activating enzyme